MIKFRIIIEDEPGDKTIVGGEDPDGRDLDVLDLTGLTTPFVLTSTGPESGTITTDTGTIDYSEIEKVIVGGGSDIIDLSGDDITENYIIDPGDGDDTGTGSGGGDTIYGDAGDDTLYGGTSHDPRVAACGL